MMLLSAYMRASYLLRCCFCEFPVFLAPTAHSQQRYHTSSSDRAAFHVLPARSFHAASCLLHNTSLASPALNLLCSRPALGSRHRARHLCSAQRDRCPSVFIRRDTLYATLCDQWCMARAVPCSPTFGFSSVVAAGWYNSSWCESASPRLCAVYGDCDSATMSDMRCARTRLFWTLRRVHWDWRSGAMRTHHCAFLCVAHRM